MDFDVPVLENSISKYKTVASSLIPLFVRKYTTIWTKSAESPILLSKADTGLDCERFKY